VVGRWHGYLSGARCKLAYGPADATATHCLLLFLPFLVPAHPGSPGKRAVKRVCVYAFQTIKHENYLCTVATYDLLIHCHHHWDHQRLLESNTANRRKGPVDAMNHANNHLDWRDWSPIKVNIISYQGFVVRPLLREPRP